MSLRSRGCVWLTGLLVGEEKTSRGNSQDIKEGRKAEGVDKAVVVSCMHVNSKTIISLHRLTMIFRIKILCIR